MDNSYLNPYRNAPNDLLKPGFSYHGETYSNMKERDLVYSFVEEKMCQFGYKATFLPMIGKNKDELFGEAQRHFKYEIEIPVEFSNDGADFVTNIAQFGFNMQDTIIVNCSFRLLNEKIKELDIGREYPVVGDQLYVPFLGTKGLLLEINFVDSRDPHNPLGDSILWKLYCTTADLGQEQYHTRNENINSLMDFDKELLEDFTDAKILEDDDKKARISEPNAWENLLPEFSTERRE